MKIKKLEILYYDREKKKIDIKKIELPYQKTFDSNCEDINIVVSNLEYGLRDNGQLDLKILLKVVFGDDICEIRFHRPGK